MIFPSYNGLVDSLEKVEVSPVVALQTFTTDVMLNGIGNQGTREVYRVALFRLFDWMVATEGRFDRADVRTYLASLREGGKAPATRNNALAAIRRLAKEAYYAGKLPHETYLGIVDIKGEKKHGVRAAQWLTLRQVNELLSMPDVKTLKGLRDRALLGVLVGCALRRSEVCNLLVSSIEQRSSRWVFIVRGKGEKTRMVGIASGLKVSIDEWVASRECDDLLQADATPVDKERTMQTLPLFCAMLKSGHPVHRKLTAQSIQDVLHEYAILMSPSLPRLAPHDCRRTHARLAREAGSDLEQIQFALGHDSIQTTTTYLGNNQNLNRTPGDMLDVNWEGKV